MTMTFFATDKDIAHVWHLIFAFRGMKVFEEYSAPDRPNRWFGTWVEVGEVLESRSGRLAAWLEPAGGQPRPEQITFNAAAQRQLQAMGRTCLLTPAKINVQRKNEQNGCLASASMTCWTEKGARQRSNFSEEFIDQVDWKQLHSAISKIKRLITKSSPAKIRSYPIMPDAFKNFRGGRINLWDAGEACAYPSPLVVQF